MTGWEKAEKIPCGVSFADLPTLKQSFFLCIAASALSGWFLHLEQTSLGPEPLLVQVLGVYILLPLKSDVLYLQMDLLGGLPDGLLFWVDAVKIVESNYDSLLLDPPWPPWGTYLLSGYILAADSRIKWKLGLCSKKTILTTAPRLGTGLTNETT